MIHSRILRSRILFAGPSRSFLHRAAAKLLACVSLSVGLGIGFSVGVGAGFAPMSASAQQPPKLEPLPEISTPPQIPIDPKLEPEIKIFNRGADKIEEFRVNGKLYMVRVTPPGGAAYVLIDQTGGGQLMPSHGQMDPRSISVPMWVIGTF